MQTVSQNQSKSQPQQKAQQASNSEAGSEPGSEVKATPTRDTEAKSELGSELCRKGSGQQRRRYACRSSGRDGEFSFSVQGVVWGGGEDTCTHTSCQQRRWPARSPDRPPTQNLACTRPHLERSAVCSLSEPQLNDAGEAPICRVMMMHRIYYNPHVWGVCYLGDVGMAPDPG